MNEYIQETQPIKRKKERNWFWGLTAIAIGVLISYYLANDWSGRLGQTFTGEEVKGFWYISRSTGIIAYLLLWFSVMSGLGVTLKIANYWPGARISNELHQYISILGLFFVSVHALILLGDAYIDMDFLEVIIPFSLREFKPFWVGLGQLGFYLWIGLMASYSLRKKIGYRTWRGIHYLSFFTFFMILIHAIVSGTDSQNLTMQVLYWATGSSVFYLVLVRIMMKVLKTPEEKLKAAQGRTNAKLRQP
jgi:predicted ferric reductase